MEHRLFAVGRGYAWHLSRASPLLDAQGGVVRWYGTTTDIDDQKHREANILDLISEVNHRSRNLLAVAQAIARSGAANAKTVQEFQERFSERLLGLATRDRKSTRLNSSHQIISYAVFCLKKKKSSTLQTGAHTFLHVRWHTSGYTPGVGRH